MNESLMFELVKLLESMIEPGERVELPTTAVVRVSAPEGLDAGIERLQIALPDWTIRPFGKDVTFVRHA